MNTISILLEGVNGWVPYWNKNFEKPRRENSQFYLKSKELNIYALACGYIEQFTKGELNITLEKHPGTNVSELRYPVDTEKNVSEFFDKRKDAYIQLYKKLKQI